MWLLGMSSDSLRFSGKKIDLQNQICRLSTLLKSLEYSNCLRKNRQGSFELVLAKKVVIFSHVALEVLVPSCPSNESQAGRSDPNEAAAPLDSRTTRIDLSSARGPVFPVALPLLFFEETYLTFNLFYSNI